MNREFVAVRQQKSLNDCQIASSQNFFLHCSRVHFDQILSNILTYEASKEKICCVARFKHQNVIYFLTVKQFWKQIPFYVKCKLLSDKIFIERNYVHCTAKNVFGN